MPWKHGNSEDWGHGYAHGKYMQPWSLRATSNEIGILRKCPLATIGYESPLDRTLYELNIKRYDQKNKFNFKYARNK